MIEETVFERILAGEIFARVVFEDEHCLAFQDVNPQAPVHVLVVPRKKIVNIMLSHDDDVLTSWRVLVAARKAAAILGLNEGRYRLVFNNGPDCGRGIDYLHCHILGGRPMLWPPG